MEKDYFSAIEKERVFALQQFHILDTDPEEYFDNLVALASQICNCSIASISLVDEKRVWLKSKLGVDFCEIPRETSFCADIQNHTSMLVVEDLAKVSTFKDNPMVIGAPFIRFMASYPLKTDGGLIVGYLCVMDSEPKSLTENQLLGLEKIANQVLNLMNLRLENLKLQGKIQDLKFNRDFFSEVFHKANCAVIIIGEVGNIVKSNPIAKNIFGFTGNELEKINFIDTLIPEHYRNTIEFELESLGKSEMSHLVNKPIEITALRKDKTEFNISLRISPTLIHGVKYFICYADDITVRKKAEKELEDQKEFYKTILNKIPTDIAVFDSNHKYLFVNPGAVKNQALREYIIGKDDFEYAEFRNWDVSIAQKRREKFKEIKETKKEIRWEDNHIDSKGENITSLRRLFPVQDDFGELKMVIGYGIDISERKNMEIQQAALVKQLSEKNIQLNDFCDIVSHNLRAPLVNMAMLVKFIGENNNQNEQKQMVGMLKPVIDSLQLTFNELVETIHVKHNHEISSEKIPLMDCVQRTMDILDFEIQNSKAVIEIDIKTAPIITFPTTYLFSIVHNLISNSLKYKSPKRPPHILIKTERIGNNIIFSVKDNGLGIDLIKHKDNFFKIGKVFHQHPNAKGFGLYMTKTQVEALGGAIWAESAHDVGTTIFIEFKKQY